MTDAYLEGFCKMAAACGVDPNTLLQKQAAPWGKLIGAGLKAVRGAGRATGAAKRVYRTAGGGLAGARALGSAAAGKARSTGSRYLELLRGGNAETLGKDYRATMSGIDDAAARWSEDSGAVSGVVDHMVTKPFARQLARAAGRHGAYGDAAKAELWKSLAARVGTVGAGYGTLSAANSALGGGRRPQAGGPIPNNRAALEADAKSRGLVFQPV